MMSRRRAFSGQPSINGIGRRSCALVLVLMILAASDPRADAQTRANESSGKTCLWAVESGGHQVFLLGSIHFLRQDDYPLPAAMERAYAASRVIVFETDIAQMMEPSVQTRMLELGMYPPGRRLFDAIGADTRQRLEGRLRDTGLPAEAVAGLKPWVIALTLSSLEFMRLGFAPDFGVDMHFFQRAQSDRKRMEALEPVEHQLQMLAGMDDAMQEKFLRQTLQELELSAAMAPDLVRYWASGQVEALRQLLFKTIDRYPGTRDRMLTRRNQAWLERIEEMIRRDEAALVIVGAMHLIGPGSVVDLLQQKGHRVEQR
jgi:uncharacterized protein YbaP (TraB family)